MDQYKEKVIESKFDPSWCVVSYTNGYYFAPTATPKKSVVRMYVPQGVLTELDPIASARMK